MKKLALFITIVAVHATSMSPLFGGQPGFPEPPVIPPAQEPGPLPTPSDPGLSANGSETNVTITISRTIVNPPGAITIVGSASSEQEKQSITAKVQEAAPGRTVNNQLTVSSEDILEPAGAERKQDKNSSDDLEDDDSDDKLENDDSETPLDDTGSR